MRGHLFVFLSLLIPIRSGADEIAQPAACAIFETNSQVAINMTFSAGPIDSIMIFKKLPEEIKWGPAVETFSKEPFPSVWIDSATKPGETHEYRIIAFYKRSTRNACCFLTGGIRIPPKHRRAQALLFVDENLEASLGPELLRFERDLAGDGWTVIHHSMPPESIGPCVPEVYRYEPGNLAGTYKYAVTLVNNMGESEPSAPSGPIARWKQRTSLTFIRRGPEGTMARRIYRAPADGKGEFKLVGTLRDNTTMHFVDDVPESSLGPALQKKYHNRVPELRAQIWTDHEKASNEVQTVILFGHLPVPYSGNNTSAHDGHYNSPPHNGTWPADMYYSSSKSIVWPDELSVTKPPPYYSWNVNNPNDGKFDLDYIDCGNYLFPIGRIYLGDMPAFAPETETTLLRKYLKKDHEFRNGKREYPRRALYDFANGRLKGSEGGMLRSMYSFCKEFPKSGSGIVVPTLMWQKYLWANVYGSAEFQQIYYAIRTSDFRGPMKAPFYSMYGSFFGDWDNTDNLLRAPLCGSDGLANMWYGAVNGICQSMALHPMAAGETIGAALLHSQNYPQMFLEMNGDLPTGYTSLYVSLMGDPTLRLHNLAPPSDLRVSEMESGLVSLEWKASPHEGIPGDGEGYYIYRAASMRGPFDLINPTPVTAHNFVTAEDNTHPFYMVRFCKLESDTAAGSYYNLSEGAFYSVHLSDAHFLKNNSRFLFSLAGPSHVGCEIESSTDQSSWQGIGSVTLNRKGSAEFEITTRSSPMFFRVRKIKNSKAYLFSQNQVGYEKIDVPADGNSGHLSITNQFRNPKNMIRDFLPGLPSGAEITKAHSDGLSEAARTDDSGKWIPDGQMRLREGESALLTYKSSQPFTLWFCGEVPD
jgi:hypothetical protein